MDTTFSGDGKVTATFSSGNDYASALAIDGEGRIVMAGKTPGSGADLYDMDLIRFTAAGEPDDEFGPGTVGDGMIVASYSSVDERATSVVVDADNRAIIGGYATDTKAQFTLACFDEDGDADTSFGSGGVVSIVTPNNNYLWGMALDSQGRIVAAGAWWSGNANFMVARCLANGQLDPSFGGGDGIVTTSASAGSDFAYAVAIGPGDQIVLAGYATIDGEADLAVVHLNADGTLTTSTTQYVYSPRYVDAVICRDVADGTTLQDGSRIYYLSDANHNVTAVVNADGEVVERYVYTPYGEVTIYDGSWSDTYATSVIDNTHLYTGRVYDGAIDMYYYRYRWYDAGAGRFVERDPLKYLGGDSNLYGYVGAKPINTSDPKGLVTFVEGANYKIKAAVGTFNLASGSFENAWGHPHLPPCTGAGGSVSASYANKSLTTTSFIWGSSPNGTCNTISTTASGALKSQDAGSMQLYVNLREPGLYLVSYGYSMILMSNCGAGSSTLYSFGDRSMAERVAAAPEASITNGIGVRSGTVSEFVTVTSAKASRDILVAWYDVTMSHAGGGKLSALRSGMWKNTMQTATLWFIRASKLDDLPTGVIV